MPHYAIVIEDPDQHHASTVRRTIERNVQHHGERHRKKITELALEIVGGKRQKGDLHTLAESECPDGLPNCRNCGDPDHLEACAAAGHCPHCGIDHGITPDGLLADRGVVLKEVPKPQPGQQWSAARRRFEHP